MIHLTKSLSTPLLLGIALALSSNVTSADPGSARGERPDPAERLAQVDTNDDGLISREEFVAARADHFAMLDRDGDGYFSELDIPERLRGRDHAQHRHERMLAEFDQDGDRLVSQLEFESGPTPHFDRADSNGDGQIDATEVHQLHPGHGRGGRKQERSEYQ
ncbi:MAG: EF-hand domain-containing protein [Pseudomonadota bacterium]